MSISVRRLLTCAAPLALSPTLFAQQFQLQPTLPGTPRWTEGVECADVDKDGDLDLFFADGDGFASAGTKRQNVLIINKLIEIGAGNFADESVARLGVHVSNAKQVTTGDVDGDGWVDALFANAFNTDTPFLYINQGLANPGFYNLESATRGFTNIYSSGGAGFADLDDDGDLDVIISDAYLGSPAGKPHLFFNNGAGVFTENAAALNAPNKGSQQDVQFADLDGDGDLDLFETCRQANAGGNHYVMTNDGAGNFTDLSGLITGVSGNTYEGEVGDLDGDTDIDVFLVSLTGFSEGAIRNNMVPNGTLTFTNQSALPGAIDDNEITYIDFDVDGDYDIVTGSLGAHEYLWRNNGALSFTDVSTGGITFVSDSSLDATVADLDNDGRYDVITAQGESNPGQWADKWYKNTGAVDTLPPQITPSNLPANAPQGPLAVHAKARDQVLDDGVNYLHAEARYVVSSPSGPIAVSIDPTGFNPAAVNVAAGDTVVWTNNSGVAQTVDLNSAPYLATSGSIAAGGTYTYVFVAPGTYAYSSSPSGFTGQVGVSGSATTVDATYSGGQIYRFALNATGGTQVAYEFEFRDWPGNVSVSPGFKTDLGAGCPAVTGYCTAKVNSVGCTGVIGSTGTPSASAGSGFLVTATNMLNNKSGLFFYGLNGQIGAPFQGGFLCVKNPIKRTAVQSSSGNPPPNDCSGAYSFDFNSHIAGGTDPNLIAGAVVDGQYWARDPGFAPPNNTNLTAGVHFTICP